MLCNALKDVRALPAIFTDADLLGLGWTSVIEDELLILRKGPLEVIFVRLPFGPDKITATLDLKKLIIKSNNAELRYVNNESPYTKATPCFSYWGGDKTLKSYTDTLAIALYNIAYKMSEA